MFGWFKKLFSSEEPLVLTKEMEVKETPRRNLSQRNLRLKKQLLQKKHLAQALNVVDQKPKRSKLC